VTFTLTGTNTGNTSAAGIPSIVDGVETPFVMLRDVIPENTTLVSLDNPNDGKVFYHAVGAPTHTYTSTPPAHLTRVDAVVRGVPSLSPGQKSELRFTVTVNANASGPLTNTGSITYSNETTTPTTVNSNTVQLAVPTVEPTITYYTNDSFTTPARVLSLGKSLFVQADASACNQDPTTIETHLIRITSALTGDAEVFLATESTPNSGIFRILPAPLTADVATHTRQSGNGQIETTINDSLIARLEGCGATSVETRILIDPGGVVFDSKTNATVAGTRVTLIDVTGAGNSGNPGGPAAVFFDHGVTPAPSTVLTGPDGNSLFHWSWPAPTVWWSYPRRTIPSPRCSRL
jgi:hypothetical protein